MKNATAPMELMIIVMQTQHANPRVRSGEVARYDGMSDCFSHLRAERRWVCLFGGKLVNCIRCVPTQALNLAMKDRLKQLFPKYSPYSSRTRSTRYEDGCRWRRTFRSISGSMRARCTVCRRS